MNDKLYVKIKKKQPLHTIQTVACTFKFDNEGEETGNMNLKLYVSLCYLVSIYLNLRRTLLSYIKI